MTIAEGEPKALYSLAYYIRSVGQGTTPFSGLILFTIDLHLLIVSVQQRDIMYYFCIFGMTRLGIEPKSPVETGEHCTYLVNERV